MCPRAAAILYPLLSADQFWSKSPHSSESGLFLFIICPPSRRLDAEKASWTRPCVVLFYRKQNKKQNKTEIL